MTKTELVSEIQASIESIDGDVAIITQGVKKFISDSKLDAKQASHLQWELACLRQHYMEYTHDLERMIKTLKGEAFAGE